MLSNNQISMSPPRGGGHGGMHMYRQNNNNNTVFGLTKRKCVVVLILGSFALLNVSNGWRTARRLTERILCDTKFGYKTWGEFWESIYSLETDYTSEVTDPIPELSNPDPNNINYFLTLTHCPGDTYPTAVDNYDPGHNFYDAAAMLKYSITSNTYPKGSKYNATVFAIVHPDAIRCLAPNGEEYDRVYVLQELGYKVIIQGNNVPMTELDPSVRDNLDNDAGYRSMMPLRLTGHPGPPIGVGVGFETLILKPLDPIFDAFLADPTKKIAVSMDYPDVLPPTGKNAGINTHFVLFKPDPEYGNAIIDTYKNSIYDPAAGWQNSGVGGFLGALGFKGFMTHFASMTSQEVMYMDRCTYGHDNRDPMGFDPTTESSVCYDPVDCRDCRAVDFSSVEVIKLINTCGAPYDCCWDESWDEETKGVCEGFHRSWFQMREKFEEECWVDGPPVERQGEFMPHIFLGYCSCPNVPASRRLATQDEKCYEQMIHDNPPTSSPTEAPTASPTEWNTDKELPRVLETCKGPTAMWWGDPHFVSFDGLKSDFQGIGEFNVITNLAKDFLVQGRFYPHSKKPVTLTDGVVVQTTPDQPIVQLSRAATPVASTVTLKGGCPLDLYVNGQRRSLLDGSGTPDVEVVWNGTMVNIGYVQSGLTLNVKVTYHSYWGCYFSTYVCIPAEATTMQTDVVGLLGNIDGHRGNDWMGTDGTPMTVPRSRRERIGQPAYEYSTQNWCVRTPTDSLFTYEDGLSHATYFGCDNPFGGEINLDDVPQEIIDICGDDIACLIEGQVGGVEAAQNAYDTQKQFDEAISKNTCFTDNDCINGECNLGQCVCSEGFADCDGKGGNGCETGDRAKWSGVMQCAAPMSCHYFNDFESFINDGELTGFDGTYEIPEGEFKTKFLGMYGKGMSPPQFRIPVGSNVDTVFVSFDFIEIDSWDGTSPTYGQDYFDLYITGADGTKNLQMYFSHGVSEGIQSGVQDGIEYTFVGRTDGYIVGLGHWKDQIHHVVLKFPGSFLDGEDLLITFGVNLTQGTADEAAGIDNIFVSTCPIV